ncbi:DNA topoisomerase 3-alpha-like isoform X2 [Styela clava]
MIFRKYFSFYVLGCAKKFYLRSLSEKVCTTQYFIQMQRQSSNFKVLNVAEKNDAAKRISEILSNRNSQRREGYSQYNKIYEFNYSMLGRNCHMIMTSLSGHLMNYEFTGSYRKWTSCHPGSLFTAEIEKHVTENMTGIKRTLEKECRSCQALVIWTDGDREGENIGFEIINLCLAIKPSLNVYRAKFSEITDRSIKASCRNLVRPDQNVSDAVDVRQELDLRIGASFTRFQTLRLQKVFPQVLSERLISYGSCQFPTLGFVVERYKAREEFQPEAFWKIEVSHTKDDCNANYSWKRNRLFDQLACQVLYDQCKEEPAVATVTKINSKPKSKWRPLALDTVELEKLASRKLHISAKETMQIAEKLYTKGYISYPRTETNMFPKEIDLNRLIGEQTNSITWSGFAENLLDIGPTPRNGSKTDNAHPPIHPTKCGNDLSGNEGRVYELIARHFLACCHRDAKGHETSVEIELGGEKFTAQGLMIIERNYLDIYIYEKWNAKTIPVYEVGEEFEPRIEMTEGATTPPNLLTEADLIALMDKHGIGTDATHAEHIETIKSRMYAGLTPDKRFLPGELGMGLVEGYNMMGYQMAKPELRAALEADLKLICDGRARKEDVLQKYITKYKEVFDEAIRQAKKLDQALGCYFGDAQSVESQNIYNPMEISSPVRPCPSCGKDMVIKRKKDGGFMVSCMGFPDCRNAAFMPKSVLDATVDESICSRCRPAPVHKVKLKLNRSSIPPFMDSEQVACICGCDEDINNVLDIRFRLLTPNTNSSAYSNQNSRQPRGGGRGSFPASSNHRSGPPSGNRRGGGGTPGFLSRPGGGAGAPSGGTKRTSGGQKKTYSTSSSSSMDSGYSGSTSNSSEAENQPCCRCGINAVQRTVLKDGPNKGRQFYTCEKPRDQQCGFFEWSDAVSRQSSSGGSRGLYNISNNNTRGNHSRGSGRSRNSSTTSRKPPTCSLCKEQGHTKRSCPNK